MITTSSPVLTNAQNETAVKQPLNRVVSYAPNSGTAQTSKCAYQAVQQAKYLHLQAEIDLLLQQLQRLKQQRLAATQPSAMHK